MTTKIARIATLLANGVTPTMVARITGVSDSYISQLRSDPDFITHLTALQEELAQESGNKEAEIEIYADKLLGAEHKLVDTIMERLPYMGDGHLIAALAKIGERRDATLKSQLTSAATKAISGGSGASIKMVEISIPAVAAPDLRLGKNNEIISIDGRSITPLPTAALSSLLSTASSSDTIEGSYHELP